MKINPEHIKYIRQKFEQIQTKNDLVILLSDAKNMLYGEETKSFQLKSMTYYANPKICKKRYTQFSIKKKSGGERIINAPVGGLKSILRSLNFVLQCVYEPHKAAMGFVREKSIVDNAKKHIGQPYVLNLDIKDFFHSFDRNRVKLGFMRKPFNLRQEREPIAFLLASLCTHPFEIDGKIKTVLPQGSPTSPTITNILLQDLDRRLTGLSNRFGLRYTRYADDITFSAYYNIYKNEEFIKELKRIIEDDQKLVINPNKTRLQKSVYRQEVTGLIVNEKANVKRRYVKKIRQWLYFWEKYGYDKAQQIFINDYIADKGHVLKGKPNLINVLDGKLEYMKMVKSKDDSTYLKLQKRFKKLTGKMDPIQDVISVWENQGIERAINLYDKILIKMKNNNKSNSITKLSNQSISKEQKQNFISSILQNINNNKLDTGTKQRLINLVSKEIDKKENINDEILERLKRIKGKIERRKGDEPENETSGKEVKNELQPKKNNPKNEINHNPKQTTEILKKFKYNNDSGFKDLVHTPNHDNYSLDDFKNDTKNAEKHFKTLKDIPIGMYISIKQIIELMKNEGVECFEKTGKHPYQNRDCNKINIDTIDKKYKNLKGGYKSDVSITQLIQNFKKNYRFDMEKSEASILKDLNINILNNRVYEDTVNSIEYRFSPKNKGGESNQIIYLEHSFAEDFDDNAIFFTWVPDVRNFLVNIIGDILKHGNINGERKFASYEKEVEFSVKLIEDEINGETSIELVIFDKKSIVNKTKELFYNQIKDKAYLLTSICDWKIETDFNGEGSYSINILPETKEPFVKIDKVNGLKHILTFYT